MRPDPRDRCIDAALAILDARLRRAVLARAMRRRRCEKAEAPGLECYVLSGGIGGLRNDDVGTYCRACVENDKAVKERRERKRDELRAFARLRTAAQALRAAEHNERFLPMLQKRKAS